MTRRSLIQWPLENKDELPLKSSNGVSNKYLGYSHITHWGRVTHICVSQLTIIGSDNGLSPGRRQAIIWTNAGILLIGPLGTNLSETPRFIHASTYDILSRPQCVKYCYVLFRSSSGYLCHSVYQISVCLSGYVPTLRLNPLRPRPNRRHLADDIFKCIFLNENVWISIKISHFTEVCSQGSN